MIVQELLPAAGKVGEFNFSDSVSTLIMLGTCPAEVLRELQMARHVVTIMIVGHGLDSSQLFGIPWVMGSPCDGSLASSAGSVNRDLKSSRSVRSMRESGGRSTSLPSGISTR